MKGKSAKYIFICSYIFLLLVCVSWMWYLNAEGRQTPVSTGSTPRVFDLTLQEVGSFRYPGNAVLAWQEWDGALFFLDEVEQRWFVMSPSGKILDTLGVAGSAPWENQEVKGFRTVDEGIYSVDTRGMVVRFMPLEGGEPRYRKVQQALWGGVHMEDDRFLLLNDESRDFGVFTYDLGSGEKGLVQRYADALGYESENLNVALEGMLLSGGSNFYYVCSRAGIILRMDREGKIAGVFSTIDQTAIPEIAERRAGNLVIFERQPDEIVNYAATADSSQVYILSQVAFIPASYMRLDRYNQDGSYQGSSEIPNHDGNLPVNILKGRDVLYVLYEDMEVIIYSLEPNVG